MFRGTVNVCLDTCNPVGEIVKLISQTMDCKSLLISKVRCSNGQLGYGRRRRDVSEETKENKIYTISMSTIIKMECDDCSKAENVEKGKQ